MEIFRVIELSQDFIDKTEGKCLNCNNNFKPFEVHDNKLTFECHCGLKITIEDN